MTRLFVSSGGLFLEAAAFRLSISAGHTDDGYSAVVACAVISFVPTAFRFAFDLIEYLADDDLPLDGDQSP